MREVKERQLKVVVRLCRCQSALCQCCLLLSQLHLTGLPVVFHCLHTRHLLRVDRYLSLSHTHHLPVIEHLDIGLSHLHTHIILGFLKVLAERLEIEFVELHLSRDAESRKEWYTCAEIE